MHSVNPRFVVVFLAVVVVVVTYKLANPNREYSTQRFWENATAMTVAEVPDEALAPGNKNGPVLMWAAIAANDPQIIRELVDRGAQPYEKDILLSGTPLTGAAAYNNNPEIIRTLVKLGADVNQTVFFDDSPLIIAARYAKNPAVIEMLLEMGADPLHQNVRGDVALDFARRYNNPVGIQVLSKYGRPDTLLSTDTALATDAVNN